MVGCSVANNVVCASSGLCLSHSKNPDAGLPTGRVLGPVRCGVNEWEALVLVSSEDLSKLRGPVERLRRAGRVRVSVT